MSYGCLVGQLPAINYVALRFIHSFLRRMRRCAHDPLVDSRRAAPAAGRSWSRSRKRNSRRISSGTVSRLSLARKSGSIPDLPMSPCRASAVAGGTSDTPDMPVPRARPRGTLRLAFPLMWRYPRLYALVFPLAHWAQRLHRTLRSDAGAHCAGRAAMGVRGQARRLSIHRPARRGARPRVQPPRQGLDGQGAAHRRGDARAARQVRHARRRGCRV